MIIKSERGLTLIELCIGIMILAIFGAITAPQLTGLLRGFRISGAAKVVWGDLHRARMMAIKENRTIRVNFTTGAYEIVRVDTAEVAFRRNLTNDFPGITVSITNDTISFGSTGTAGGGGKTVQVQSATASKSFTIITTGRIGMIS
jgi:prepilin-type N-terminal cleavage/methylation domain-containing protein